MLTSITYLFPGLAIIFLRKTAESPYGLYAGMEFYKIAVVAKNRLASTFLSSTCLRWVTTKINAHTHKKFSTVICQFATGLTAEVNSSHAWDKYPFFLNIVHQKISNMPLDAHKSTHIFEKQVISAANAVKFLFLTRENSQVQDKKQRCERSRRTLCSVQKRICIETAIHSTSCHICMKGSYPLPEIRSKLKIFPKLQIENHR